MKQKKFLMLLLAAVLALSLCACGKSEAAQAADQLIAGIGDVTLSSERDIAAAESAVAALEDKERDQLDNLELLKQSRAAYDALVLDQQANEIEALISAIGSVSLDSVDVVNTASDAYDAAPAEVQALVENAADLESAVSTLAELRTGRVADLIGAIGTVTLDSGESIAAAQAAFDALPGELQAQVPNAAKLEAAAANFDQVRLQNAAALIDAIGTVTVDSGGAIDAAQAAFEALPDSLQAQVVNAAALEAAQTALKEAKHAQAQSLLASMRSENDAVRGVTFYYAKVHPVYADSRCYVLPYIGVQGDNVWLCAEYLYTGDDWIFFDKLTFAVDDARYYKTAVRSDLVRDHAYGNVWEYINTADVSQSDIDVFWAIANSNQTIVRFEGNYIYDLTVSATDKAAIRQVLTAYEALTA